MSSAFDGLSFPAAGDYVAEENMFDFDYNHSFTALNQPTSSAETVSPHELLMSAPGSTEFGLLDTPESSFLDSPAMASSAYHTTPLEDGALDNTLNYEELKRLQPLFADADQFAQASFDQSMGIDFSPVVSHAQPVMSNVASPMVRQKSSPGRPPISGNIHARKHSLTSGIVKCNKHRKSLPEIEVDSADDRETAKRKKNTQAARKSRQRRAEDMEYLQAENQRLRSLVEALGGSAD